MLGYGPISRGIEAYQFPAHGIKLFVVLVVVVSHFELALDVHGLVVYY